MNFCLFNKHFKYDSRLCVSIPAQWFIPTMSLLHLGFHLSIAQFFSIHKKHHLNFAVLLAESSGVFTENICLLPVTQQKCKLNYSWTAHPPAPPYNSSVNQERWAHFTAGKNCLVAQQITAAVLRNLCTNRIKHQYKTRQSGYSYPRTKLTQVQILVLTIWITSAVEKNQYK